MVKLIINNQTTEYDISNAVSSVQLVSSWQNGADKLTFDYINNMNIEIKNGDNVSFYYDEKLMFRGVVFINSLKRKNICNVTCYDQRRYLKAKDTILRNNQTLTQFISANVGNVDVVCGSLTDSVVKLEKYLFDNVTYLDMIYSSINDNLLLNGYYYVLRNDGGELTLKELTELRLPLVVGDGSIAYDYEIKKSIDNNTYNKVKVAMDNKKTGLRDIYVVEDSSTFNTWGVLQYFEKVTAEMNESQLKERAELLLKVKNHEEQRLKVECIGNNQVMGGNSLMVEINELDLNTWAIVDKVTHSFKSTYTMSLELVFE